jgi:hypothetical protein
MFNLFKKKRSPDEQAQALRDTLLPAHARLVSIMREVDSAPALVHEAGLFVAIIALLALDRERGEQVPALREAFVAYWLVQLADGGDPAVTPSDQALTELLFEHYPRYRAIDADATNSPVQWVLELLNNCGGNYHGDAMLHCMPAVPKVNELVAQIRQQAAAARRL